MTMPTNAPTGDQRALVIAPKSAEAAAWELLNRRAMALAASSLVPKDYANHPANCIIALQLAERIGADPMMVMQNLDVIHGRPAWRSTFLIATVNASGRFTPLRFRWQGQEGTAEWGCRAIATDKTTGEECVGSLITVGLAVAEGWTTKNGSKWKTMPEQMLMYRAATFWTRVYAPELSLGMRTGDELADTYGDPGDGEVGRTSEARSLEAALRGDDAPTAPTLESETVAPATDTKPPEPEAPVKTKAMRQPGDD